MNPERKISRRTFLDWLLTGGLVAWAIGFIAPVLSYVWPAQRRGRATIAEHQHQEDNHRESDRHNRRGTAAPNQLALRIDYGAIFK